MTDKTGLDLLGIKPLANSVEKVVDGTVSGAAAFLSRICLPAAEEFGLLLRDKVSTWRGQNIVRIVQKAEDKILRRRGGMMLHAHPESCRPNNGTRFLGRR